MTYAVLVRLFDSDPWQELSVNNATMQDARLKAQPYKKAKVQVRIVKE